MVPVDPADDAPPEIALESAQAPASPAPTPDEPEAPCEPVDTGVDVAPGIASVNEQAPEASPAGARADTAGPDVPDDGPLPRRSPGRVSPNSSHSNMASHRHNRERLARTPDRADEADARPLKQVRFRSNSPPVATPTDEADPRDADPAERPRPSAVAAAVAAFATAAAATAQGAAAAAGAPGTGADARPPPPARGRGRGGEPGSSQTQHRLVREMDRAAREDAPVIGSNPRSRSPAPRRAGHDEHPTPQAAAAASGSTLAAPMAPSAPHAAAAAIDPLPRTAPKRPAPRASPSPAKAAGPPAKKPRGGQRGLSTAIAPDEPMPLTGSVPPAAARGHQLLLARPFLFCTRCGSFMRGNSGRGDLLGPCDPRSLKDDKQRQGRLKKLSRGQNPLAAGATDERPRQLMVDDAETGYIQLVPCPP